MKKDGQPSLLQLAGISPGAPKAREIIAAVVGHRLAPELKALGFRKKGLAFARRQGETAHAVRLELSSWNLGDRGSFTVHIAVMFDQMKRMDGREVPRFPRPGDSDFFAELAELVPGAPRTWEVNEHLDVEVMSQVLCSFVVEGVLAKLDSMSTLSDFERTGWVRVMPWRFPARYAYAMGRLEEAGRLVREEVEFFADRGLTYEEVVEWCRLTKLRKS